MQSTVSFAPLRPAGFVNFCGAGRGGARLAFRGAGQGEHPCCVHLALVYVKSEVGEIWWDDNFSKVLLSFRSKVQRRRTAISAVISISYVSPWRGEILKQFWFFKSQTCFKFHSHIFEPPWNLTISFAIPPQGLSLASTSISTKAGAGNICTYSLSYTYITKLLKHHFFVFEQRPPRPHSLILNRKPLPHTINSKCIQVSDFKALSPVWSSLHHQNSFQDLTVY